jgi:Ca-activated chloride channel family protein
LPASFGFRPVAPAVGSTERVPGDLGELTGKQLGELLTRWPKEIMKPGALMLVLDSSGSMEGEPLRASKESIRNLLPRLDPRDQVGFLTFGSDVKDRLAVGTKLQSIFEALDAVQPVGGSSAYDALKAGMDELSAPSLNGYRRTLIMITDGEGLNSELSLQGIQDYLSSRLSRYDVNIQIIALKREGADFSDLEKIARGVNGYFRAATAAELMGIIQEAMRNV